MWRHWKIFVMAIILSIGWYAKALQMPATTTATTVSTKRRLSTSLSASTTIYSPNNAIPMRNGTDFVSPSTSSSSIPSLPQRIVVSPWKTPTITTTTNHHHHYHSRALGRNRQKFLTILLSLPLGLLAARSVLPMLFFHPSNNALVWRNVFAGTLIFGVGDAGAQLWESMTTTTSHATNRKGWDSDRWMVAIGLGAVWAGYGNPLVYATVDRWLGNSAHFALKMLCSCSILTTFGNYGTMMVRRLGKGLLQERRNRCLRRNHHDSNQLRHNHEEQQQQHDWLANLWKECRASTHRDFPTVVQHGLKIWPVYDLLCFACIPAHIRPITTATVAALWSMYLSVVCGRNNDTVGASHPPAAEALPSAALS